MKEDSKGIVGEEAVFVCGEDGRNLMREELEGEREEITSLSTPSPFSVPPPLSSLGLAS